MIPSFGCSHNQKQQKVGTPDSNLENKSFDSALQMSDDFYSTSSQGWKNDQENRESSIFMPECPSDMTAIHLHLLMELTWMCLLFGAIRLTIRKISRCVEQKEVSLTHMLSVNL